MGRLTLPGLLQYRRAIRLHGGLATFLSGGLADCNVKNNDGFQNIDLPRGLSLFNALVPKFDSQTVVEDLVRRAHMSQTDDLVIGGQLECRENLLAWYCDMCAKKGLLPEGVENTVVSMRGVLDCRGIGFTSRRLLSEESLVRSSPAGLEMLVVRLREPSEPKEQNEPSESYVAT